MVCTTCYLHGICEDEKEFIERDVSCEGCGDWKPKLKKYIVDLCSFSVEADNPDKARENAIQSLKDGTERAVIDMITEDVYTDD